MVRNFTSSKRRKALLIAGGVLALAVIYFLMPAIAGRLKTSNLRSVFAQQNKLLAQSIASLGVVGDPDIRFQCIDRQHTHWQTEALCQNFSSYVYNFSPMSAADKSNYAANAAKFDELLKQNGWVPDRPRDAVTTLAGLNPTAPLGSFASNALPLHKNVGPISCNLTIMLNNNTEDASAVSINVNEFSCSQNIWFFMPHLTTWQATGP